MYFAVKSELFNQRFVPFNTFQHYPTANCYSFDWNIYLQQKLVTSLLWIRIVK